jgi:hypothetical protein
MKPLEDRSSAEQNLLLEDIKAHKREILQDLMCVINPLKYVLGLSKNLPSLPVEEVQYPLSSMDRSRFQELFFVEEA